MSDGDPLTQVQLETELAKMKRRQGRNQRAAFAQGLLQGVCSMLTPDDVVLDCGANVGVVSTQLAATGAQVHAFEPDPFAFEKLTSAMVGLENVTLHNVAVGTSEDEVTLMRAQNFDTNPKGASVKSTVLPGGRGISLGDGSAVRVQQIDLLQTIADLSKHHRGIAFLKMDIEGAELELLEAMHKRGLFADIRLTVAETHERKFKELRPRFRELRRRIAEAYPITHVNLDWI